MSIASAISAAVFFCGGSVIGHSSLSSAGKSAFSTNE
tara:strand:+ start:485 stop:595 length:111 start_codon:yes stop_codon:yes gene_type:complete